MTLEDLLKKEDAHNYNLMDEMYSEENPICKALKYKYAKDNFDCDGSGQGDEKSNICFLIREIYRELWGWQDKIKYKNKIYYKRYAECNNFEELLFGPETITSFLTTFKQIINNNGIFKNNNNIYLDSKGVNTNNEPINDISFENEYIKEICESNNYKELYDKVVQFCKCVGKIGNMTLTIAGFNKYTNMDYWDLKIDTQYLSNRILSEYSKKLYINMFFLWDYVNYDENKRDYSMKLFFEGHKKSKPLPETIKDICALINQVCKNIDRRGELMINLLKLKRNEEEKYNKLIKEIIDDKIHNPQSPIPNPQSPMRYAFKYNLLNYYKK